MKKELNSSRATHQETPLQAQKIMLSSIGQTSMIPFAPLTNRAGIHPDIKIRSPVNDPVKMLATLCKDNKVTYLGDVHGQCFVPELVGKSAKDLKRAGVDLLAIEFVKYSDNAAFREALAGGKSAIKNFIFNAWAPAHGEAWVDSIASAIAEAHNAGITVAGIDRHMAGGAHNGQTNRLEGEACAAHSE